MPQFDPDPQSEPPEESTQSTDDASSSYKWVPTEETLKKLIAAFSENPEKAAQGYELARSKLIRYFERHVGAVSERCADEALDRAMRRIDEGKQISNLMAYLYKIASNIVFEMHREDEIIRKAVKTLPTLTLSPKLDDEDSPKQTCFDECLEQLPEKDRTLIVEYYEEEGHTKIVHHKQMAARLGIQLNALRIRVHRIRVRLEADVKACVKLRTERKHKPTG
jgi:RNA polymerase sigma factor (sigma-70 family)